MKRIKYYTESQADTALSRLKAMGDYPESVKPEYDYFYINVIEVYRDWFTADELLREYDLNGVFNIINNPTCTKVFKIGIDIIYPTVCIYGNSMSQSEVDAACTAFIDNFDSLGSAWKYFHIGTNPEDLDRSNATPGELVLASLMNRVTLGGCKVVYFDSVLQKNIELI